MTPRMSQRARAREIYREMADKLSPQQSEAAPTPDPSPLLARASGGGEKKEVARAEPSLTAKARDLYENSAVPVREIAQLCGVTERTIYKYAAKGGWKKRYRVSPDFVPAKGAGGRFIRRDDKDKSFARGLKATDPSGRAGALAACRKASRLSRAAQAKAAEEARDEELIRALTFNAHCLGDLRRYQAAFTKGRRPSLLHLRVEQALIGTVEWSASRLQALAPTVPVPPSSPVPPPRYDPDDFRAWQ